MDASRTVDVAASVPTPGRLRLGVVIPTYQRPEWLARAHRSLVVQEEPPEAICIVCRESDAPTLEVAARLAAGSPVPTAVRTVSTPGHIPPVQEGTRYLAPSTDLVALMDDDAEAESGWSSRARLLFDRRPRLGALGGRVRNLLGEVLVEFAPVKRASYVSWRGHVVGDMYKPATFSEDREAVVFMGGNCCLRSAVWSRLEFDLHLNGDVAFSYELDLALQVAHLGWEIRYDPQWTVRHHNAPRLLPGMRGDADDSLRTLGYNICRIYARRLRGLRRVHMLAGEILGGSRRSPGLLAVLPTALLGASLDPLRRFRAANAGRLRALLEVARGC